MALSHTHTRSLLREMRGEEREAVMEERGVSLFLSASSSSMLPSDLLRLYVYQDRCFQQPDHSVEAQVILVSSSDRLNVLCV